jgi:hypothetical protein
MLHALRRSPLAPTLRRLLAVLLGLCVSVTVAEPLIADPCDDPPAALAVGTTAPASAAATVVAVDLGSESGTTSAPDQHTMHLCHCAHTHGVTLTARHALPNRVEALTTAVSGQSDRLPSSVVGEPQIRPPRVLSA